MKMIERKTVAVFLLSALGVFSAVAVEAKNPVPGECAVTNSLEAYLVRNPPKAMLALAHGDSPTRQFAAVSGVSQRVEVDVSAEPHGAIEFDVDSPACGSGPTLNAADFGVSETNADNTAALRAAFAAAKARHASRLVLPNGVYRVIGDSPFALKGLQDFTFDGGGSTFVAHRREGPFMTVDDCVRVVLRNFTLDWDWSLSPLASIVEVVATDGKTVDLNFPFTSKFFLSGVAGLGDANWSAFVLSMGQVALGWLVLYFLYRKNVFFKV